MLSTTELNLIIKELHEIRELDLPYNKGMVPRNKVIKILKDFTRYEVEV